MKSLNRSHPTKNRQVILDFFTTQVSGIEEERTKLRKKLTRITKNKLSGKIIKTLENRNGIQDTVCVLLSVPQHEYYNKLLKSTLCK